jgi:LEA14-like dessication related protein
MGAKNKVVNSSNLRKILIFVLIILIIYAGLWIYSLSKIEVKNVNIDSLQDLSLTGFTLGGNLEIYNDGIVPVTIDHINYAVTLESSGKELTRGNIIGKKIPAKKTVEFPFSNQINWIPTAEVAIGLITPGQTYAKMEGTVYVADLQVVEFKIPFEKRLDLEPYIKQFVKNKVEETINNVVNTVTNTVNKVVEGIKNIFS